MTVEMYEVRNNFKDINNKKNNNLKYMFYEYIF